MINKKIFSYLVVIGILGFLVWSILSSWDTIVSSSWSFGSFDIFLISALSVSQFFINVLAWHLLMRALGLKMSFFKNFEIWVISNASRFLPGGFWQYPGRILLLSREGVSKVFGATCLALEALFVIFVSLAIVLIIFISGHLQLQLANVELIFLIPFLLFFLFLLFGSEKFMTRIAQLFISVTGRGDEIRKVRLPFNWIPILVFVFFLEFLLPGVVLFLLSRGVVELSLELIPVFVGIHAASWIIGYISFFAPGGLGVREAAISGFLSFYMPFSVAVVVALAFRASQFFAEIIAVGVVFLLSQLRKSGG